ncbi:hypothetical protein Taro_010945 [Colocasia esculenta]|uniref:Uncharacterized protein n=1 Tax=Colocasia esculenta TaxID=4460 RepID=A0A843U974_COLES|nr:hypothetical protein [Colocasia esculenta]
MPSAGIHLHTHMHTRTPVSSPALVLPVAMSGRPVPLMGAGYLLPWPCVMQKIGLLRAKERDRPLAISTYVHWSERTLSSPIHGVTRLWRMGTQRDP